MQLSIPAIHLESNDPVSTSLLDLHISFFGRECIDITFVQIPAFSMTSIHDSFVAVAAFAAP